MISRFFNLLYALKFSISSTQILSTPIFSALPLITLLTACTGEEAPSTPYTFNISAHTENTLMANVTVTTEENATVVIQFESDGIEAHQTPSSELGTEHEFIVVGLRAQTDYQFTANITDNSQLVTTSESQPLTTGALPEDSPTIELLTRTNNSAGGITFFAESDASTSSRFYGIDEDGYIVWYLHDNDIQMPASPVIRLLDEGRLMLLLTREARIIDITGKTLESYPLPAYHHDAILLDSGNLMALSTQTQTINGQSLKGDLIVEVDPEGNTLWEWSTFDHLDTTRFPGTLSTRTSNGSLDWTHSNAILHLPEEDTILLSSRSQSWVINIDHDSSDIIWIMGSSDGAADHLQGKFFSLLDGSWMASQHAPVLTKSGDFLIYDNRNEAELAGNINNSRAVRFTLNTDDMTAEQQWEYVSSKYTSSLGDVDELANGNVLINSGGPGSSNDAHILEVTSAPDAELTWEISIPGTSIYRAERISWQNVLLTTVHAANQ